MVVIENVLYHQSPVTNKEDADEGEDDGNGSDYNESGGPAWDEVRRFMGPDAARC